MKTQLLAVLFQNLQAYQEQELGTPMDLQK